MELPSALGWMHLAAIRRHYRDRLAGLRGEAIDAAVRDARQLLAHDIDLPELNTPAAHPDVYMLRANQIGLALVDAGLFAGAEALYRALLADALANRQERQVGRHVGALHANIGTVCLLQGRVDEAVVAFLRAADDDVATYGVTRERSFALTDLMREQFSAPVQEELAAITRLVDGGATRADIEGLCGRLGEHGLTLLAYARALLASAAADAEYANEFSQMQVFSALRNLCALLEVELKTIAGAMGDTFGGVVRRLYQGKTWWPAYQQARAAVGEERGSTTPADDRLRAALALAAPDADTRFWKGLLVALIVRNYTAHQMAGQSDLVRVHCRPALAHILHVLLAAPARA
ncbi:MAG: hypothetical protein IT340_22115 [Chloroflexi bacterium]|nr:hypothetical protein [Chloroflexota bacterium]